MINDFSSHSWPNAFDMVVTIAFLAMVVILPAIGYVFMVLDYRAYLRSLRRSLAHAGRSMSEVPKWAYRDTPRPLAWRASPPGITACRPRVSTG